MDFSRQSSEKQRLAQKQARGPVPTSAWGASLGLRVESCSEGSATKSDGGWGVGRLLFKGTRMGQMTVLYEHSRVFDTKALLPHKQSSREKSKLWCFQCPENHITASLSSDSQPLENQTGKLLAIPVHEASRGRNLQGTLRSLCLYLCSL